MNDEQQHSVGAITDKDAGRQADSTDDGDLHTDIELDIAPEAAVTDSLNSALQHLRESADKLTDLPMDDTRVAAAEQVAERAAELDEQIGAVSRRDDH